MPIGVSTAALEEILLRLVPLPSDNPFITAVLNPGSRPSDSNAYNYRANMRPDLWVEIFWAGDEIPLTWGDVDCRVVRPTKEGRAKITGAGHNIKCKVCNVSGVGTMD